MASSVTQFDAVFNILIILTVITLITNRLRFPRTLALILAGIYASFFARVPLPEIEAYVFMTVLLPPILFQETFHLSVHDFTSEMDSVLSFAVLGTLAMILGISVFSWLLLDFSLTEALLLGIIIAPTDPVAVIGTFQSLKVSRKFQILVTGESLLNDGVAIVIYSIMLSVLTLGALKSLDIVRISLITVLGGLFLGVLSGYLAHLLFCWTDDKFVEVLISFLVAFGVFRVAEGVGASGVIATVFTGLIINYRCRNYGGLGSQSREMLDALWEFMGFIAQSIAFIFIGINTDTSILSRYAGQISLFAVFTLLARLLITWAIVKFLNMTRNKSIPDNWTLGISWSGLRGGVSIVLALGVGSLMMPRNEEILALTFGIVLITNIFQGLSMPGVLKTLKLSRQTEEAKDKEPEKESETGGNR
jgi:CPA1 family monovalent cation:H+ antiporter